MIKTLAELAQGLNAIYPTQFSHFEKKQKPPYICYIDTGEENFYADDDALIEGTLVDIELYTINKDLKAEKKIKDFLRANKLSYTFYPSIRIESEGVFQCVFSIKLIN